MNRNTALTLLAGIIIGATGGWLVKPVMRSTPDEVASPAKPGTKRTTRDDAPVLEKSRDVARWMERLGEEGGMKVVNEIPTEDMRAVMEKMMAPMSGGMDAIQVSRLGFMMSAWAERDPEGALAWARGRNVLAQREIALTGVAVVVGKKDPMAGFEIFTEVGTMTVRLNSVPLTNLMYKVYQQAFEKGVDGLLEIARRTPETRTSVLESVSLDYPDGFDFAGLIDGLEELDRKGSGPGSPRSFSPARPLSKWAVKDPDAAFDYAVARGGEGRRVDMGDMGYEVGRKSGTQEADRWMGEKLASLDSGRLATLLPMSGLLDSPGHLRNYIRAMPEEAAAEFRYQAIKASPQVMEILQDVPDVEERLAVVGRLRGVKDTGAIAMRLRDWGVPLERIGRVLETVTRAE